MAGMRMSMRKIREVLRLTHELGLSVRDVCEATGVGKTAVCEYVNRARVIGITWPIPPLIDDAGLERRLFTPAGFHAGSTKPLPDWTKVHEELKRRSVTLMILWEEHRAEHVDGHGYSRFCELYGAWRKRLSPTMRQTYVAGDKLFVDWAGGTVPIIDPMTGEVHEAYLFVAVLGASSYTYAEARWSETLPDWIGAHVNALDFLGGVPKASVPDNLKAGITKPSRYEPGVNRTYQDLADHYGFVVLPARIRRPRDKAKVEAAVGIVSRYASTRMATCGRSISGSATRRASSTASNSTIICAPTIRSTNLPSSLWNASGWAARGLRAISAAASPAHCRTRPRPSCSPSIVVTGRRCGRGLPWRICSKRTCAHRKSGRRKRGITCAW